MIFIWLYVNYNYNDYYNDYVLLVWINSIIKNNFKSFFSPKGRMDQLRVPKTRNNFGYHSLEKVYLTSKVNSKFSLKFVLIV